MTNGKRREADQVSRALRMFSALCSEKYSQIARHARLVEGAEAGLSKLTSHSRATCAHWFCTADYAGH